MTLTKNSLKTEVDKDLQLFVDFSFFCLMLFILYTASSH